MRRRNNLSGKEVGKIKELHGVGFSCAEIGEVIGCSKATVNVYVSASNAGFETATAYYNARALELGFVNHGARYVAPSPQEVFENGMVKKGLIRNSREYLVRSVVPDLDVKMDREEALELLASRHYSTAGITYGHENPSGAKEAEVVIGKHCNGETFREIGERLGIPFQRVEKIEKSGLMHLNDIMTKIRIAKI